MRNTTLMIWSVLLIAFGVFLILVLFPPPTLLPSSTSTAQSIIPSLMMDLNDSWISRLANNLLGYSIIIIPGFIIMKLVQKRSYLELSGDATREGCTPKMARLCFYGDNSSSASSQQEVDSTVKNERSTMRKTVIIIWCFFGLQLSYLIWGVLQERIMTLDYQTEDGKSERFRDSQFLVFVNRILAFVFAGVYVLCTRQPRHKSPIYKYSFCSFSNIMSSWCQYEALKYVNFPIQVLTKASKIIPVMLMGKLVSRKTYEYYEYVSAIIISAGMTMFFLGNDSQSGPKEETMTTFSGIIILAGYMIFDSFTSNWQGELYKQHSMSHMQMMCGVNMFSVLFTSVSLLQQGGFIQSSDFMWRHPSFVFHIVILSLMSATGQIFIFYTISQFGPVVFTIMMTIRQLLAIIISCIYYHHAITAAGIIGIILVFSAIFLRIYCSHRKKQLARMHKLPTLHKV